MAKNQISNPASRSQPKSRPKLPNMKATSNSAVIYNGKRGSAGHVNNCNSSSKVKPKYQEKQATDEITSKCEEGKDASIQIPGLKYESELERTLRLRRVKRKPSYRRKISAKRSTTLANCNGGQVSVNSPTSNASNPSAQSNVNVGPVISKNENKVNSLVESLAPSKPKTVNIWKFNDGTTVKKIY